MVSSRSLLPVFLLLLSLRLSAQPLPQEELKRQLQEYFHHLENMQIDSMLDRVHPGLFDLMPRASMKAMMESLSEDMGMSTSFSDSRVKRISPPFGDSTGYYAVVDYASKMEIKIMDGDSTTFDLMVAAFQLEYGEEQVTTDIENLAIRTQLDKQMWAYLPENSRRWYVLEFDESKAYLVDQIIPPGIQAQYREARSQMKSGKN